MKKILAVCVTLLVMNTVILPGFSANSTLAKMTVLADDTGNWDEEDQRTAERGYRLTLFKNDLRKLIEGEYDNIYAGCWLGFDTGPYVGLTKIDSAMQKLADKYGVIIIKQNYSFYELVKLQELIVEEDEMKYENRLQESSINETTNRLELTLLRVDELRIHRPYVVRELENDDRIVLFSREVEETEEGFYTAYNGGDKIIVGNANLPCSIGFAAKSGSSGGFVTAGHCGDTSAQGKIVKVNGVQIGYIAKQ